MTKPKATKVPVHMMIEEDLVKRIDNYRFEYRFTTRLAAVRELLDFALQAKKL